MAAANSFDVVSKIDIHELDNAINQAQKELSQRYDLKGTHSEITFNKTEMDLKLESKDEFTLKTVVDILQSKMIKRGISIKALDYGKVEPATQKSVRQKVTFKQGIDKETSKKITKHIKDMKLKVQVQVQGEEVRVSSKSRDELQEVITSLKAMDLDVPLQFENYR
jgi:hypothetical protein